MTDTDVSALIHEAATNGVELWVEGGQLRFRAGNGRLTDRLRVALQIEKSSLIAALSVPRFRKRSSPQTIVKFAADRNGFWKECEADCALRHWTHFAAKLTGTIELERLQSAFQRVILRHDLLRSRVRVADDGTPFFRLCDDLPTLPGVVDLSRSAAASTSSQVEAAVERAIYAPFEDGRIYRAQIIKVSESEYVVAFVVHHYVVDAVSVDVLSRDLILGLLGDENPEDQDCNRPFQYADYLHAMSEWVAGPGLEYRLRIWREKMRGVPGVRFPLEDDEQNTRPNKLCAMKIRIEKTLRAKLIRAIAVTGVPLSVAILAVNFAALAITFHRTDFYTLLLYSGRDEPALFDMVGSTINSIPLRVTVPAQMSFADLLIHVQDAFTFAVAHRVPWGILRPVLAEIGAGSVAPFFNYQSYARDSVSVSPFRPRDPEFRIERVTVTGPEQTNIVDWKSYELQAFDNGTEVQLTLKYIPAIYRTTAIEEFADTFRHCLEALAADPSCRLQH